MHRFGMPGGPKAQTIAHELCFTSHQVQFHEHGFSRGLAQVSHSRGDKGITVLRNQTA